MNLTMKELLSVEDLMDITGEGESTWRRRLQLRELPFIKLGANVRVRREDLHAYLVERTIAAVKKPS